MKQIDILKDRDEARSLERQPVGAIGLNAQIATADAISGVVSGSLAMRADSGYNLSDLIAWTMTFVTRRLKRWPPSQRHTYGLGRVDVTAAMLNMTTILIMGPLIIRSAVIRLMRPVPILSEVMLIVALVGFGAIRLSVLLPKGHGHDDRNMRAARLHRIQHALSSLAVVLAALLSPLCFGLYLYPIALILVVLLMRLSGWRLLRSATLVLLEGTPAGFNLETLRRDVQAFFSGGNLHNLHVWELRPNRQIWTAHVRVANGPIARTDRIREQNGKRLHTRWGISHSTLDVETVSCGNNDLLGQPKCSTPRETD